MKMNFLKDIIKMPSFIALVFTITMLGLSVSATNPFLSLYCIQQAGMTPLSYGVLMSITMVFGLLISTLLGKASDSRFSRKSIIIFTLLSTSAAYVLFALFTNYYVLLAVSAIFFGISFASFPQVFAYARDSISKSNISAINQPLAMNILRMFYSLGWIAGPSIGSVLVNKYNFFYLFLIVAATYIFVSLIAFILFRSHPVTLSVQEDKQPVHLGKFMKQPQISSVLGTFILLSIASSMSSIVLPLFFTTSLHGNYQQLGWLFSITAIVELPLMIVVGVMSRKMGKTAIILIGIIANVLYFLVFAMAHSIVLLYFAQVLSAISVSIIMGYGISYFQELLPEEPGTATTLYSNTSRIGSSLGGVVSGTVSGLFGYRSVFVACMTLSLAALSIFGLVNAVNRSTIHKEAGKI
ncbi:sugar efflux transporter [Paenibacillus sp. FSL K6-1096]|uniref:sugar efflux transporter n=1 Tax=Paenibacillus sp. FSL K6-1096 TaxID=2921460 RepID=UPI0030EF2C57